MTYFSFYRNDLYESAEQAKYFGALYESPNPISFDDVETVEEIVYTALKSVGVEYVTIHLENVKQEKESA